MITGMMLLTGVIISLVLQGMKWLSAKFGAEQTRAIILITLFIGCFCVAVLQGTGKIDMAVVKNWIGYFVTAIAFFETVISTIITLYNKYKTSDQPTFPQSPTSPTGSAQ